MELFRIERTQTSPDIIFSEEEYYFALSGVSRPENTPSFYKPVLEKIKTFSMESKFASSKPFVVEINLNYYNSPSFIYLIEIFKLVKQMQQKGLKVLVNWYFTDDDELIFEAGQELSDISDLSFNFIQE